MTIQANTTPPVVPSTSLDAATIDRDELRARLASDNPPILVEALPAPHFARGHLPGAINIPHDQTRALAPTALPDRQAEIVVYCASDTCRNSHIAANTLRSLGYQNVRVYPGGKKDWQEAPLPLAP